ncbi:MAG: NADPH:quinone reductase-like Zn-dependent oxidoreductase [Mariniblastus sp.]|jgi:NADPH:quinone reductase-like Zn-dependent oxidoreductase
MRQIWIPRAGLPEVLDLREAADPPPKSGEVRVRVEAAGVNFADISGRLGIYQDLPPMPVVVGYEVAGRVDCVGAGVDSNLIDADVLALTQFGGYSDVVCVPVAQVFRRPVGMSAEIGAAIPVNFLTAYQLVCVMGGLSAGETMLVHSAGGGVGIAAIQLAKHLGATVIGTASAGKHEFLRELGVAHCIDYRTEDFEQRVNEITDGAGVELVLDAVGGDSFKKSFRSLSATGRLGMFGISSAATGKSKNRISFLKTVLSMPWFKFTPPALINQNKGVFGVNLGHLWGEMDRVSGWLEEILGLYESGVVRPVIAKTFSFEDAALAHHYIQDRKNIGKVLLIP